MRPASVFDTVEVKLPCPGGEFILFRDLMGKGGAVTNICTSYRLRSGCKLDVKTLKVEVNHWSGDNMLHLLQLLGYLRIQVNQRTMLDLPLRTTLYCTLDAPFTIKDTDDIKGFIKLSDTPWEAPVTTEWKESTEVTDEQLILSGPLARLNPILRRSRTISRPVSRPMSGSHLVTVHLQGELSEPVGQ